MKRLLYALPAALAALLLVPALAFGATEPKIGGDEKVTQAMFVIIAVIAIVLAVAVWFESRKDY